MIVHWTMKDLSSKKARIGMDCKLFGETPKLVSSVQSAVYTFYSSAAEAAILIDYVWTWRNLPQAEVPNIWLLRKSCTLKTIKHGATTASLLLMFILCKVDKQVFMSHLHQFCPVANQRLQQS